MEATAPDLQRICRRVIESDELREAISDLPGPEPGLEHAGELWYWRRCLPVAQTVHMLAARLGYVGVHLVLGQFQDETDSEPLRHAWLELEDGTIVDPTSAQMGGPECAIVDRPDPAYSYYHSRGSWQEGEL